ncbi:MAG: hypothetical protein B7Z19_04055, partial [Polynucleobacter sp. 32-46-5]
LPSNIIQLVQNAVLQSFNGEDGGTAVTVGSTSYSGRYYANINAINPNVNVIEVYLGTTSSPSTLLISMGIDQLPTLAASNILVTLV